MESVSKGLEEKVQEEIQRQRIQDRRDRRKKSLKVLKEI